MKERKISTFGLVMINLIAIDSLRNLPASASMGSSVIFFYIISAIFFLVPCALITAELATHYPKTGGPYVWVKQAFGEELGFLNIWFQWLYNVIWYPTLLSFMSSNIAFLIGLQSEKIKIFNLVAVIVFFTLATLVNAFGIKTSSVFIIMTGLVGTFIPILTIIFLGFFWFFYESTNFNYLSFDHKDPIKFFQIHNISFFVIIIFSLMGIEMSASHAEEVKDPLKDYPRALLISSVLIFFTLMLGSLSIAIIVPGKELNIVSGITQALIIFFSRFHLEKFSYFFISLIILGSFGSMSAWVIGPAKGIAAASNDGCAPKFFSKTIFGSVPINVLILQWIVVVSFAFASLFSKSVELWYSILSVLSSQVGLLFYVILFCSAIKLRYKTPKNEKAYKVPGGNFGIWMAGISGIASCLVGIFVGFIPPDNIQGIDRSLYVLFLIFGILSVSIIPILSTSYFSRKLIS